MAAMRAAASSIPRGSPSTVSQISVTAVTVSCSLQPEVGTDGPRALDEERDGIGRHASFDGERRDGAQRLAVDRKGLA